MAERARWRKVPGWPHKVRSRGAQVKSPRGPLKLSLDPDGYPYVTLQDSGRRWRVHVARLVLLAFRGEPPFPGAEACHWPDSDKGNCDLENLRWGTHRENEQDKRRTERINGRVGTRPLTSQVPGTADLRG